MDIIRLRITPSAKRNTYSVAILFFDFTQGRGATHLNPGLGNRNSYRVAAACTNLLRVTPTVKRNSYRVAGMHSIHYGLTKHGLNAKPHLSLYQGKETRANRLKHSRNKLKPLEEVWGGAAALGRGIWIDTKKRADCFSLLRAACPILYYSPNAYLTSMCLTSSFSSFFSTFGRTTLSTPSATLASILSASTLSGRA